MKNGQLELQDSETLKNIYRKLDIYGNTKEPLTVREMVLIYALSKWIEENVNGEDSK